MTKLICVSAGQLQTKKVDHAINRRHRYLNYGLLSLATILQEEGWGPVVIHGHFLAPEAVLNTAKSQGLTDESTAMLLSIPSFYAVGWSREFMALVKSEFPRIRFIVGGRWVIDDHPERLKTLLPDSDVIVPGLAEGKIADLLRNRPALSRGLSGTGAMRGSTCSSLDYRLLYERHLFQPSIEISRGCGMGCSFCQERSEPLERLKAPEQLVAELARTLLCDELVPMTPYFEASMFVPTQGWLHGFRSALERQDMAVRWRSEGRVDNIRPELVPAMAAAGLTILDLGLESASPVQLSRMHKTKTPARYLEKASDLLQACGRYGVKVKINILLYPGENEDTIAETLTWLEARRDLICGVSVGPVIVFGWPESVKGYMQELRDIGASWHSSPCEGVTHMNLSPSLSHEQALQTSRAISRKFMTAESYYFLKSFSYFGRDYRYPQFLNDAAIIQSDLSFETRHLKPHPHVVAVAAQAVS